MTGAIINIYLSDVLRLTKCQTVPRRQEVDLVCHFKHVTVYNYWIFKILIGSICKLQA